MIRAARARWRAQVAAGKMPALPGWLVILVFLLLAAAGCATENRAAGASRSAARVVGQAAGAGEAAADPLASRNYGGIRVAIRWPDRQVAQMPDSTVRVGLRVRNPARSFDRTLYVPRLPGALTAMGSLVLVPAGNGYAIEAYAFRDPSHVIGGAEPHIAYGVASGLNIAPSQFTTVRIVLTGAFETPFITGVAPDAVEVGDTVTLTGQNLGAVRGAAPAVVFNGATASVVVPVDGSTLQAVVPPGGTTGPVSVVRDGISSDAGSVALCWVAGGIDLALPAQANPGGFTLPASYVYAGKDAPLAATVRWIYRAGDTATGSYSPQPAVTVWNVSDAAAGTITAGGLFTAALRDSASAVVTAAVGSVVSAGLTVNVARVAAVGLDKASAVINGIVRNATTSASFKTSESFTATVTTTVPFDNGVSWSTDRALVELAQGTRSVTVSPDEDLPAGAAAGDVVLTATSRDDPAVRATASVTVRDDGNLYLEVD